MVIIGSIIGDGEHICLSKNTGKLFSNNHGKIYEYDSFIKIFLSLIDDIDGMNWKLNIRGIIWLIIICLTKNN